MRVLIYDEEPNGVNRLLTEYESTIRPMLGDEFMYDCPCVVTQILLDTDEPDSISAIVTPK